MTYQQCLTLLITLPWNTSFISFQDTTFCFCPPTPLVTPWSPLSVPSHHLDLYTSQCPRAQTWELPLSLSMPLVNLHTFWWLPKVHIQLRLSPKCQTHKSNCLLDISTWMSNRHLTLIMPKTEFLIVSPKLPLPMVSPISLKGNTLSYLLRPKAFELSSLSHFTSGLSANPAGWILYLSWIHLFAIFAAISLLQATI